MAEELIFVGVSGGDVKSVVRVSVLFLNLC